MKNSKACNGVQIKNVISRSLADQAHFKRGDLIKAIDGQEVSKQSDVFLFLDLSKKRGVARVSVVRNYEIIEISMKF